MTHRTLLAFATVLCATLSGGVFAQSALDDARSARVMGDKAGALAILEQALAEDPNHAGMLFERGVVRAEMGKCGAAQRDWRKAAAASPTADVVQAVEQARTHLCATRPSGWEKSADLRVIADPNYNNATEASTITIGGLPFTLSDDARAQERTGIDVNGRLAYRIGVSRHMSVVPYVGVGVLALNDEDDSRLRASTGVDLDWAGPGWSFKVGPVVRWEWGVSGQGLVSTTTGVQAAGVVDVGTRSAIGANAFVGESRNSYAPDNGKRVRGEIFWSQRIGEHSNLRVALSMGITEKEPSYRSEHERKLTVVYTTPLGRSMDASFGLGLGDIQGDGVHPVFGVERRDTVASISAGVTFHRIETPFGSPSIGVTHTVSDSNIALYSFDKTTMFLGFSRSF